MLAFTYLLTYGNFDVVCKCFSVVPEGEKVFGGGPVVMVGDNLPSPV